MSEPPTSGKRRLLALWLALFAIYTANGREIGAWDSIPAHLQAITLWRGDGFLLDRFAALWPGDLPYYVTRKHGLLVSRYPTGTPLVAFPFALPQLLLLDTLDPGWDSDPQQALIWAGRIGKISAAAIGASTAVLLYLALVALVPAGAALTATLIAVLGSNLWMTASQSLWQHGPAALAISATLALLLPPAPTRWRLFLAGGACATAVACRPSVLLFALLVLSWVLRRHAAQALWFCVLPAIVGALLLRYNLMHFGTLLGGYGELSAMVGPATHSVSGLWGEDIGTSLLGTLFSPSHGLFVFSPWVLACLVLLPTYAGVLRQHSLIATVMLTLPILLIQLAWHSTWWGGWSFGARYWTDVVPLLAVLLAYAIAANRRRPWRYSTLLATGAFAIAVQLVGALCYPSSFNARPGNIDHQHERLWSWRDGELARCLREGPKKWGK